MKLVHKEEAIFRKDYARLEQLELEGGGLFDLAPPFVAPGTGALELRGGIYRAIEGCYCSILEVSCFMWNCALDISDLLLSHP